MGRPKKARRPREHKAESVYSAELERSVLHLLTLKDYFRELIAQVDHADFYEERHRDIFAGLVTLHNEGRPLEVLPLVLSQSGKLDGCGAAYVVGITANADQAGLIHSRQKLVTELKTLSAKRRAMLEAGDGEGFPDHLEQFREYEAAQLLIARSNPIRCVGKKWFVYRDGAWTEGRRDAMRPAALAVMHPTIRTTRREAEILTHVESQLQIEQDTFRGFYRYDGEAVLLNVRNGVVRVTSDDITLEPHNEHHLFTLKAAGAWSEEASPDVFLKTINEALPDESDRSLLQLFAGNILLPDSRHEAALVCVGPGGCGKSTVAESLANALGEQLVTRLSLSQLCDSTGYHLPNLRLAALNLGTELDSLAVDESSSFKALVSGEPIQARAIYKEPIVMQTSCKLLFLGNELPRFKNGTDAELRRLRLLRFDQKPAAPNAALKHHLQAERDGILSWMILGLWHLLKTKCGIPQGSERSREAVERFSISNDPIKYFLESHCTFDPGAWALKEELQSAYQEFCGENGLPVQLSDWFLRKVYERYPYIKSGRKAVNGRTSRVLLGLELK